MAYLSFLNPDQALQTLPLQDAPMHLHYLQGPAAHLALSPIETRDSLGIITWAKGGWLLLAPFGRQLWVNEQPVLMLKVLEHGDVIRAGQTSLHFTAEEVEILGGDAVEVRRRMRCPGSQDLFQAGDAVVRCPRCKLTHSLGAWLDNHKCGRLHCNYPVRLTAEEVGDYAPA
jgi:hypothetical protein